MNLVIILQMITEVGRGLSFPESNKPERRSKKINILMFILLCLLIAGLGLYAYARSKNISLESINPFKSSASQKAGANAELSKIKYDSIDHPDFIIQNQTIIKYTKDYIKGIGKNGDELWTVQLNTTNPLVKASDGGILVADIEGKDIYVIKNKEIKWSKKLDDNIINADINDKGYVTVVHEAKGYRNAVTEFNSNGEKYFSRFINETNVLSARASSSGDKVLITSVDTNGVTADTNIEFTDKLGNPLSKVVKKDSILPYVNFLGDDYVLAAGNSSLTLYDDNYKEKWNIDFKNSEVFSAIIVAGKYAAAAVGGEGQNGSDTISIKILDTDGKSEGEYKVNSEVKGIYSYGKTIGVNTGRQVLFINTSGELLKKFDSQNDITKVCFFDSSEAMIVSKADIEIFKIN